MKRLAVVFWMVAICATAQVGEEVPSAEEVWERAVEAKGGRERLYSIENVASIARRSGRIRGTSLIVFPGKFWIYSDMRPLAWGVQLILGDESGHWIARAPPIPAGPTPTDTRHPHPTRGSRSSFRRSIY